MRIVKGSRCQSMAEIKTVCDMQSTRFSKSESMKLSSLIRQALVAGVIHRTHDIQLAIGCTNRPRYPIEFGFKSRLATSIESPLGRRKNHSYAGEVNGSLKDTTNLDRLPSAHQHPGFEIPQHRVPG